MNQRTFDAVLGLIGFFLIIGIVVLNTAIVFFWEKEYTGGMLAVSVFWFAAGWVLLSIAMDD